MGAEHGERAHHHIPPPSQQFWAHCTLSCTTCHTGKKKNGKQAITAKLNEEGAKCTPRIEVYTQSAQSPDFNINDLAFFRALSCAVSKQRRGKVDFDKDKLTHDVETAWWEYPEEKLALMWEYHDYCLRAAIDYKGGNDYPRHRSKEEKARVRHGGLEPPKKKRCTAAPTDVARRL
jgi:hypothetical protein